MVEKVYRYGVGKVRGHVFIMMPCISDTLYAISKLQQAPNFVYITLKIVMSHFCATRITALCCICYSIATVRLHMWGLLSSTRSNPQDPVPSTPDLVLESFLQHMVSSSCFFTHAYKNASFFWLVVHPDCLNFGL